MSHSPSPHDTQVHILDAAKQLVLMLALGALLALALAQ